MVRFDSYRAASAGNWASRNLVTKSTIGGRATWQAVMRVKFEQASKAAMWTPTRRMSGEGRADREEPGAGARQLNNHNAPIRTTGVVSTACEEGNLRQWGRPGMVGESRPSNGIFRMSDHLGVGEGQMYRRSRPASPVHLTLSDAQMVRHPEDAVRGARLPDHPGPPPLTQITFLTCRAHYPGGPDRCVMVIQLARSRAGFFPIRSAFPAHAPGRRPHCSFRGLLELHTHYGLPGCSPTYRGLCHEVSASPVSRARRSIAIESNHQLFEWVLPPLVICPFGAHARVPAPHRLMSLLPCPYTISAISSAGCSDR